MSLDFRSVIFTCSVLTFFVASLLWVYALALRKRRPEILAWAIAYGLLVVGSILIVLRGKIPDLLSIVLSNACVFGFLAALRIGIFFFRGWKPRLYLAILSLTAFGLCIGYLSFIAPSFPGRFYFYNCCIAAIALLNAASLGRKPEPPLAAVSRIAASMLALIGLSSLARIAFALTLGLPEDLMHASAWDSFAQVIQAVAVCTLASSFMLLRAESLNAELSRAVSDRELLVREMAHRTENDLTLVDSLISLEENAIKSASDCADEPAAALGVERFDALRERIRCMARAHERLSMSKELHTIRLDEYLDAVAEGLPVRQDVVVERDFAHVELPFSMAVPVGLVMNELAVNALKYAFPEDRRGRISLALRVEGGAEGEKALRLEVSDDGIGTKWPPDRRGLGSMIVESFAKQLSGKLEYAFRGGSFFSLSFAAMPTDEGR